MVQFNEDKLFNQSFDSINRDLFTRLIDMVTKSNQFLNVAYSDQIAEQKRLKKQTSSYSSKNNAKDPLERNYSEDSLKFFEM